MIYQSQTKRLSSLQVILRNQTNEVEICEDLNDSLRSKYTVIVLDDHSIVRRFLKIYNDADYLPSGTEVEYFSSEGRYLIVYPYIKPRPLFDFYMGKVTNLSEAEEICRNLIVACMTSALPWPVLYLVLKQQQVNLAQDRSVHLSYAIDFSELNEDIGESECVVECAKMLLEILKDKSETRADSYVLLQKKINRQSYGRFIELYRDIDIAGVAARKKGILVLIRAWYIRNRDTLFRILLTISLLLLIFTIISLITNAIFGDVPWLRIFIRSFEHIGLESLV